MRTLLECVQTERVNATTDNLPTIAPLANIEITNVSMWANSSGKITAEHFFNLIPAPFRLPFTDLWFEWDAIEIASDTHETFKLQCGVFAGELTVENDYPRIAFLFYHKGQLDLTPSLIGGVKLARNPDGSPHHFIVADTITLPPNMYDEDEGNKVRDAWLAGMLSSVFAAIAFMNCKNVDLRLKTKSQKQLKKLKKLGKPIRDFHYIEIHKTMVRTQNDKISISGRPAIQHAHMVRGHFKKYTDDNKLFGRITGAWFWQSHIRGTIGEPTIGDYRVWPADKNHKSKCVVQ